MNPKAVPHRKVETGLGRASLLLLALVGLLSVALTSSAAAAPAIGKGGQISACYLVKGKAKGAMRVVPAGKKCRRGERKLAWSVAGRTGPSGQNGTTGAPGAQGSPGANGSNGVPGTNGSPGAGVVALEAEIASLDLKVGLLEGVLDGVDNSQLTTALDAVSGLTNADLTEAVGALPAIDSLCTQASSLTTRVNSLGTAVGGLSLNGALTVLGGLLNIPVLPAALPAFTCPS